MAVDKEFLTGIFGQAITEEQIAKIVKEKDDELTGIKINRDTVLTESKGHKEKSETLAKELETLKAEHQKKMEELEAKLKAAGGEELKAVYEAEATKLKEAHNAELLAAKTATEALQKSYNALDAEYLKVLKNTELDRAMDAITNLKPEAKNILRDVFWARNQFDFVDFDGKKELRTGKESNYRTIADTLAAFINTKEGKEFVLNENNGGGSTGSTGSKPPVQGNPFTKGKENLDEQARLLRENKPMYDQLKAQAEAAAKDGS
jgi:hypothetical protein